VRIEIHEHNILTLSSYRICNPIISKAYGKGGPSGGAGAEEEDYAHSDL
jgi:hypothetical protein